MAVSPKKIIFYEGRLMQRSFEVSLECMPSALLTRHW